MSLDIVRNVVGQMPSHWATCPIYRKGVQTADGGEALGKSPLGRASKEDLRPQASLLYLERNPDTYGAVGVYTGPRSGGLVILDVDMNLGILLEKWPELGECLPRVRSPKKNACKYLFQVPQDLWDTVSDISLAASKEGFEVLWGRQGILTGSYHAGGEYTLEGELGAVPAAPEWLIARMQERKRERETREEQNQIVNDRYRMRSKEERLAIVKSCLAYIPNQGAGSYDFWFELGAMVHSADLGDLGLEEWRKWSKRDEEYADYWAKGDRCAEKWKDYKFRKGGLTLGSLIRLADTYDPERKRFRKDGLTSLVEETEAAAVEVMQRFLSGPEVLEKALELEETVEDPALRYLEMRALTYKGGLAKEGVEGLEQLIDAHLSYKRTSGSEPVDVSNLDSADFEYLIPGLLPKPWLLLVHADGGTGKSAMAMTICKHVSQGKPFNIHGAMVNVPAGRCLWLNGDQSERITKRQFNLIGVETGVDVIGEWDMQWYNRFKRLQKKNKYDLVVIDSLDGCNDSNPYEENRREYAGPLKKLARRNGVDFPPCTFLVIHHNNKSGGFRGTTAIKAAVDETWNMQKLDVKALMELNLTFNSRVITVEKSRDDREGQQMVFSLMPDYTYKIAPMPELDTRVKGVGPTEFMLQVLAYMREAGQPLSLLELKDESCPVGGKAKERALQYAVERLASQGLIQRCDPPAGAAPKGRGRPPVYYKAVGTNAPVPFSKRGSRGDTVDGCVKIEIPSAGTDLKNTRAPEKSEFAFNQEGTDAPEAQAPVIKNKASFDTEPRIFQTDCAGTDLNKSAGTEEHKESDPEARFREACAFWD